MKRFAMLLLAAMMVLTTFGQSDSDATAIAKLNLELGHIEIKADSIEINSIFDMLVSLKQKTEEAEKQLSRLAKGYRDYIKQEENLKIYEIKYKYLINAVNQRYAAVAGYHIIESTSTDLLSPLRDLIVSRRAKSILEKYKQLSLDYIDSKYKYLGE